MTPETAHRLTLAFVVQTALTILILSGLLAFNVILDVAWKQVVEGILAMEFGMLITVVLYIKIRRRIPHGRHMV